MTTLTSKIEICAKELFGKHFVFRDGQLTTIESIVNNVLAGTKHIVLEAPTGSGKSIISLIAAYFLYREYKKTSYILVSDLSLFDQYVADIDKVYQPCFGHIKGKENYICHENGCVVSQSTCALQGLSIIGALHKDSGFSCASACEYAIDYRNAVLSPITLMTYQLYFIQRNYVEDCLFNAKTKNKNFPKRDLVICDECHKICDICQSHFAPRISVERPDWMTTLDEYMPSMAKSENERLNMLYNIEFSMDNDDLMDKVYQYRQYVLNYCNINNAIRKNLANATSLSRRDRKALAAGNQARQAHCKIDDLQKFIAKVGSTEYVVKTNDGNDIVLNFVYDNMMLKKYMHDKSGTELLMSATIGDCDEYAMLTGLDKRSMAFFSMKSSFDFSKSPIYVSPSNKMSNAFKKSSFPLIAKQIEAICRSKQNMRGIIQTGSYQNSDELKQTLSSDILQRCMFYNNSCEKKTAIETYKSNDNAILVGPTLIEGLNFPDDLCRFQICIKVPYAYFGNEYVKKKACYIDGWYEYDAITKLCQGIGRGIRHKNDWCETYILDGCIMNIINKLEDIQTLSHRFKLYE